MTNLTKLTSKELAGIKNDRAIRQALGRKSHHWFFLIYLSHYIKYPFAPFHHEMFKITEDERLKLAALIAFRSCGKTTLMSLSYPIWSIIGSQKKKFVLIASQTQNQSRSLLSNIKRELESNDLLKADIGPFEEESDEWGAYSIVLSRYDARITAVSTEQSIRGIRHGEYRPDLVICDDVEDLSSVKAKETRDKVFDWLNGEIFPIGDQNTKFLIVGNLLHEDSLMMRLKKAINEDSLEGKFFVYPILDAKNQIAWPRKFKTMKAIEKLRKRVSESAWYREYLLKIIADKDRIVRRDNIHHYDELPDQQENRARLIACGVDLAISTKDSANYTGIIAAYVIGYGKTLRVYILSQVVNKRMIFVETSEELKRLDTVLHAQYKIKPTFYIESVNYQAALPQHLVVEGLHAEPVTIAKLDKRSRLSIVSPYIEDGRILFPHYGCEVLIDQIVNFGVEKYDDLADALTIMMLKIIENDRQTPAPFRGPMLSPPRFRNFGDGPVDVSKPITAGLLNKKF